MAGDQEAGERGRARSGLQLISSVVRAFSESASDYHQLLDTIARSVAQTIPDTCVVLVRSDDGLTPVAVHDADPAVVAAFGAIVGRARPPDETPLSTAAMTTGPVLLPQLDLAALRARMTAATILLFEEIGARGILVVPIQRRSELFGVVAVIRRDPARARLDELDLEIVAELAGHAALALATSRLLGRLHDELARREAAELALVASERERLAKQRALEDSMFLDAIVEHIPDMVFVKDADRLAFVRFNRAGEVLLGVSRAELLGKTDFDLFPTSEAEFFVAKDRETLGHKTLVDIPEEPIHTRAGKRWLHTKKVPLLDADGVPRYLLGISQDITEGRLAAAKLEAARAETDQVNRELESFTYSVAHDLRAPLRGILGYTQAILEDHPAALPAGATRSLHRVREAAERMALLIDDLLGLSRVTRAELVRDRVDLTSIAHSVVAGLRAGSARRIVEVTIAPDLVADGDARLLAVVLEHLFDNAWKFTSKRATARIELGAIDGDRRTFFVRDNGAGFDPAHADQLFGVFQRLHRESEFPGTGIGLATVARIIHRHHGRVWAEGAVDQGATFSFVLGDPP